MANKIYREGHYALYLDSSLLTGSSAPCPTFDNEVLCAGKDGEGVRSEMSGRLLWEGKFEVVGVEVWGVKMGG